MEVDVWDHILLPHPREIDFHLRAAINELWVSGEINLLIPLFLNINDMDVL